MPTLTSMLGSNGLASEAPFDGVQYARQDGTWVVVNGGKEYLYVNTNYTTSAGEYLYVDTTAGPIDITLPASPANFDVVMIADYTGNLSSNNLTILRNGNTIQNESNDLVIDRNYRELRIVYYNGTWNVFVQIAQKWLIPGEFRITGTETGNEGDQITLFIDGWDPANTYNITNVTGGTASRITDWLFWTLPSVNQDESHTITVEVNGIAGSFTYTYEVQVFNVPTLADDSISVTDFSVNDSNTGWVI